jgi:hypothetical protein
MLLSRLMKGQLLLHHQSRWCQGKLQRKQQLQQQQLEVTSNSSSSSLRRLLSRVSTPAAPLVLLLLPAHLQQRALVRHRQMMMTIP